MQKWTNSCWMGKNIEVYEIQSKKILKVFVGHSEGISSVTLNQKGNLIVSGSGDSTVRLWKYETGEELKKI